MRRMSWFVVPMVLALSRVAMADGPAPSPPAAAFDGGDEVLLKNGGMIRGTVTELEPGKAVSILVLGSGEHRVIAWDEVEHVNRGAHPSSAPPSPPAPPLAPASPTAVQIYVQRGVPVLPLAALGSIGVVRLHIETDNPHVELRRIVGTAISGYTLRTAGGSGSLTPDYSVLSEPICRAPCDQVVDGRNDAEFFFGGSGVADSSHFQLTDKSGPFSATVKAGSASRNTGGLVAALVGGAVAVGMGIGFGLSVSNSDKTATTIYGGIAAAGLLSPAAGIYLLVTSGTDYQLKPTAAAF